MADPPSTARRLGGIDCDATPNDRLPFAPPALSSSRSSPAGGRGSSATTSPTCCFTRRLDTEGIEAAFGERGAWAGETMVRRNLVGSAGTGIFGGFGSPQ